MEEIWKDIEGYEGRYQVSNLGRVRSLDRKYIRPNPRNGVLMEYTAYGKLLKPKIHNGYYIVSLYKNSRQTTFSIHRLVATTFIKNENNYHQVNHKNEIKTDNRVENLEWCTCYYNTHYGTRNERLRELKRKNVLQLDTNGNIINEHLSIKEAAIAVGVNAKNIWLCLHKKQYRAGGFCWRFSDE